MFSGEDIKGKKFGKLTVLEFLGNKYGTHKNSYVLCKCACGKIKEIIKGNLTKGITKSCGCLKRAYLKNNKFNRISL